MSEIKQAADQAKDAMIALRRDLHRHPELGYQEHRTAGIVEAGLRDCGCEDVRRVTGTGVVGLLRGGKPGPVLMLRADMDALPVTENTGLSYASEHPGVMHACAHDGHTAILLSAARALSGMKSRLAGSIKFVFEPNEEEVGALAMIEAGVLEGPKVDAAAGLHLWAPLPTGQIAVEPGACWAGMDHFRLTVRGKSGHTAQPHTAVDPIFAAAQIIAGVQVLHSRELDPLLASTLLFGRIHGGTAANIIADQVELEGTLRYLFDGSDDGPHKPRVRLRELVTSIAATYRAQAEIDYYCSQPALINDPGMTQLARSAALETLGTNGSLVSYINLAGEDFSEFSARVPSVFAMIGCGNAALGASYPHHHAKFDIDEAGLSIGLEWMLRTACSYLS